MYRFFRHSVYSISHTDRYDNWGCPLYKLRGHRLESQTHFYTPEDCFNSTNGVDPDEMPHFEAFHLRFHC